MDKLSDKIIYPLIVTVVGGVIVLFIQFGFFDKKDIINKDKLKDSVQTKQPISIKDTISELTKYESDYQSVPDFQFDIFESKKYFMRTKTLLEQTNLLLQTKKLKSMTKSIFENTTSKEDSTGQYFTNHENNLEVWQNSATIGIGIINQKKFKEFYISNDEKEISAWFRTASDTTNKNVYPVIRTEFTFNKETQLAKFSSRLYVKDGTGTALDIETAKNNLKNSFDTWQIILRK